LFFIFYIGKSKPQKNTKKKYQINIFFKLKTLKKNTRKQKHQNNLV